MNTPALSARQQTLITNANRSTTPRQYRLIRSQFEAATAPALKANFMAAFDTQTATKKRQLRA